VSYWTYPCRDLREAWYALRCIWLTSKLRRILFYFSKTERAYRWHLARARALGCAVYCVFHADDMEKCKDDPIHQ
jgi:hypothetical protein